MTTMESDVYYDPYDFEIDTDPYPIWKRLRDERPSTTTTVRLLRAEPVRRRRALLDRLADLHLRQGHAARDDQERHGDPARIDHFRGPPGPRPPPEPAVPGLHAPQDERHRAQGPRVLRPQPRPAGGVGGFDFIADLGAQMPMRTIGMLLGIPEQDQEAIRDTIDDGLRLTESAMPDSTRPTPGHDGGRGFRGVHRLAGQAPVGRPDDRTAPRPSSRTRAGDPPADPPRGARLRQPAGGGGKRDDHPADRLDRQGAGRAPGTACRLVEDRSAGAERHRGAAPLRVALAGTGPVRHQGRRALRTGGPRGQRGPPAHRVGQPRRAPVPRRRPLRRAPHDRPPRGVRLRDPLLPGCRAGPAGGSGRTRRGAPALPHLGGRLGQRRSGPDVDGAGLGKPARHHP